MPMVLAGALVPLRIVFGIEFAVLPADFNLETDFVAAKPGWTAKSESAQNMAISRIFEIERVMIFLLELLPVSSTGRSRGIGLDR